MTSVGKSILSEGWWGNRESTDTDKWSGRELFLYERLKWVIINSVIVMHFHIHVYVTAKAVNKQCQCNNHSYEICSLLQVVPVKTYTSFNIYMHHYTEQIQSICRRHKERFFVCTNCYLVIDQFTNMDQDPGRGRCSHSVINMRTSSKVGAIAW